jgi:hypothetical protein
MGYQIHHNFAANHCRNAQRTGRKFFLSDQFAICVASGLERDHSARKVGIGPVGVRPLAKSELPP